MNVILNHLWQSTAFVVFITLVAIVLRRNSPRVRYWLWFAASIKFLIPFSLIVSTGARVPLPRETLSSHAAAIAQISTYFDPVSEVATVASGRSAFSWGQALAAVWLMGVSLLLIRWFRSWRTVHRVARGSIRLPWRTSIPVLSSFATIEPGVFGIFRPVLLLPEGFTEHLTPNQLNAILAHELRHIRCFDNLTAAIHMVVETLFWFHPLVWWIGTKLVDERERDCDEAVLIAGNQPGDYARGILHVCNTYVRSQLPCASGISGSNLKKRIHEIMTWRGSLPVTMRGKALLVSAALAAVSLPFGIGMMRAQGTSPAAASLSPALTPLAFEVTSVKPTPPEHQNTLRRDFCTAGGRFAVAGTPVLWSLTYAFHLKEYQVSGAPAWLNAFDSAYDIEGKPPAFANEEQCRLMVRSLFAERFKLMAHMETKESSVYLLTIGKNGTKLREGGGVKLNGSVQVLASGKPEWPDGWTTSTLAGILSNYTTRPVVDRTGLPGTYGIKLDFSITEGDDRPNIFTAVQNDLGLNLEAGKAPIDFLVIDHIEKPNPN